MVSEDSGAGATRAAPSGTKSDSTSDKMVVDLTTHEQADSVRKRTRQVREAMAVSVAQLKRLIRTPSFWSASSTQPMCGATVASMPGCRGLPLRACEVAASHRLRARPERQPGVFARKNACYGSGAPLSVRRQPRESPRQGPAGRRANRRASGRARECFVAFAPDQGRGRRAGSCRSCPPRAAVAAKATRPARCVRGCGDLGSGGDTHVHLRSHGQRRFLGWWWRRLGRRRSNWPRRSNWGAAMSWAAVIPWRAAISHERRRPCVRWRSLGRRRSHPIGAAGAFARVGLRVTPCVGPDRLAHCWPGKVRTHTRRMVEDSHERKQLGSAEFRRDSFESGRGSGDFGLRSTRRCSALLG